MQCPGCGRYFCRECASEHDGRYLCVSCIRAAAPAVSRRRELLRPAMRALLFLGAFYLLWQSFYVAGYLILQVPTATHDARLDAWDAAP